MDSRPGLMEMDAELAKQLKGVLLEEVGQSERSAGFASSARESAYAAVERILQEEGVASRPALRSLDGELQGLLIHGLRHDAKLSLLQLQGVKDVIFGRRDVEARFSSDGTVSETCSALSEDMERPSPQLDESPIAKYIESARSMELESPLAHSVAPTRSAQTSHKSASQMSIPFPKAWLCWANAQPQERLNEVSNQLSDVPSLFATIGLGLSSTFHEQVNALNTWMDFVVLCVIDFAYRILAILALICVIYRYVMLAMSIRNTRLVFRALTRFFAYITAIFTSGSYVVTLVPALVIWRITNPEGLETDTDNLPDWAKLVPCLTSAASAGILVPVMLAFFLCCSRQAAMMLMERSLHRKETSSAEMHKSKNMEAEARMPGTF